MIRYIVVVGAGLTIPFFRDDPSWSEWIIWPAGMYVLFGGLDRTVPPIIQNYQLVKSRDSRAKNSKDTPETFKNEAPKQTKKLTPKELQHAKTMGVLYAELGAVMDLNARIAKHRKDGAAKRKQETKQEKTFALKWAKELKSNKEEIDETKNQIQHQRFPPLQVEVSSIEYFSWETRPAVTFADSSSASAFAVLIGGSGWTEVDFTEVMESGRPISEEAFLAAFPYASIGDIPKT